MFTDDYIEKEQNYRLFESFIKLCNKSAEFEFSPRENLKKVRTYNFVPDISEMAENLKSCLQESHELPKDFTKLFDTQLFSLDTDLVPEVAELYKKLKVDHK